MNADSAAADASVSPHGFRSFCVLWASQSLSVLGSSITWFAMILWLTRIAYPGEAERTGLAWALTALSLASILPGILLSPLLGVVVDRSSRRRLMLLANVLSAATTTLMVLLILTERLSVPWLIFITVARSIFSTVLYVAFDASYIMLVPERRLPRANGMMQTMQSIATIGAPALAASLVALPEVFGVAGRSGAWAGIAVAVAVDAVTFWVAALVLLFLTIPSPPDIAGRAGRLSARAVVTDLVAGVTFIRRHAMLVWLLTAFALGNVFAAPVASLLPLVVRSNLSAEIASNDVSFGAALAAVYITAGVAGVAGGTLISVWGGLRSRRIYGVIGPLVVAAAAQVVLGLSRGVVLLAIAVFLIDAMLPIANAHTQSIWQSITPRELQGRVFAVRRTIVRVMVPLGTALGGWLASVLTAGQALTLLGAVGVVLWTVQLFNPAWRQSAAPTAGADAAPNLPA